MMRAGQWESAELIDALEDASLQAERAADIIRGMRNFLRKGPSERTPLDLPRLVDEVIRLVQHEARAHRIEIHVNTAADLPAVRANRTEIEQVLFNLLLNAIEAIPDNQPGRRQVTITLAPVGAHGIEVAVADSGAGFVEGIGEHLFDPFFSTKQEGMGMGLSICRTIVEAHGGELRAKRNALGGATFHFILPTFDQEETDDEA
jgi:C4-dicarboxylate-specific signal transduction histidine kinase